MTNILSFEPIPTICVRGIGRVVEASTDRLKDLSSSPCNDEQFSIDKNINIHQLISLNRTLIIYNWIQNLLLGHTIDTKE